MSEKREVGVEPRVVVEAAAKYLVELARKDGKDSIAVKLEDDTWLIAVPSAEKDKAGALMAVAVEMLKGEEK